MPDPRSNLAGSLTRFSLKKRITVLMAFLTILVVGLIAAMGIPLELFPRGFEGQSLFVSVPWPNAPTQEVLDKLTLPLEEELSTVSGLKNINSFTTVGRAGVYLHFKTGTSMDVAYREVRDRVERARVLFPEDVERVFIRKEDASGIPVLVVGLAIDPTLTSYYDLIQKEVVRPLARIDGVANVTTDGLEEKAILIEIDRERAESSGLNIYQLAQSLRGDNFTMASGNVREGARKYLLRSVATYQNLNELENRPVTPNIRLKDIAAIRYEEEEKRYAVRVNSQPAVAVVVFKEGEANTVDVSRRLREAVTRMQTDPRLASLDMDVIFSQGQVVEQSVGNLLTSGRIGGMFACLVLFLFLRRFRLTLIVSLSIPLSMLIALIVMYFAGETLNILTMLGLVICVGLLVDNSVVVAENIHRHYRDGLPTRDACIAGASEIALAITMATLTTIIVFLPMALVEGEGQFFLMRLSLPISVSLVASLLVALIFIPLSVYLTLPSRKPSATPGAVARAHEKLNSWLRWIYEITFGSINRAYNRTLGWFLDRRLDLILVLIAAFALSYVFAFKNVNVVPIQEEDQTSFNIHVSIGNQHSFEDVAAYFAEAETLLASVKDQYQLRGYLVMYRPHGGQIQGWFHQDSKDHLPAKDVARQVADQLPKKPGVELFYGRNNEDDQAEREKNSYSLRLEGDDHILLEQLADTLKPLFTKITGVTGLRTQNEPLPNELALVIDREQAANVQANPEVIAGVVGYALRGQALPRYHDDGREVPVRIRFEEEDRTNLAALARFYVPTEAGQIVPLETLVTAERLDSPKGIFRRDKRTGRSITLELDPEEAKETRQRLDDLKSQLDLPEGMSFEPASFGDPSAEVQSMTFAGLTSILFIYLLMGFLFESFILPLSIILTIPLASLGVVWIHAILGKDLDILGLVGAILLIGVVVNNGIVLVDYINRLRLSGLNRREALLKAAEHRFRPIVMTALTTIIGMIPLAVSEPGDLGLSYKSFGLTLIGGMSTATLLTLLVVPVFYTLFDDARLALARAAGIWDTTAPAKASPALSSESEGSSSIRLDRT